MSRGARPASRAALLALALLACQGSPTADRERRFAEARAAQDSPDDLSWIHWRINERNLARIRLTTARRHAFAARFAGQVQPGVGCDVCPDECGIYDLRPLPADTVHRLLQEALTTDLHARDSEHTSWFEIEWLRCVGEVLPRASWGDILGAISRQDPDPGVRYHAALLAIESGWHAEGRAVLESLAAGDGMTSEQAQMALEEWDRDEIQPSY